MSKIKIGLLTGGGDAPGLNAVIHAFVKACYHTFDECEIIGYRFGYRGLYNNNFIPLNLKTTSGILHKGGTILCSSNKDNLFDYPMEENGVKVKRNVSHVAIENMRKENVDVLVVLGGDGTLTSARDFSNLGVNVIGIPKTIDNDLGATDITFGFDTAVGIVTENLGRIHTTAESHQRVMIVEVMGRHAGWIALHAGIAGSADVILIPEIPYKLENILEKIKQRDDAEKYFTVIVIGEGAKELGGEEVVGKIVADSPDPIRFGGIAAKLASVLEPLVDHEVRSVQLGHIQRGGDTSSADRLLSVRYAIHAVDLIKDKKFGRMVCLQNGDMGSADLNDVINNNKYVKPDDELIYVAKKLGICLG